MKLVAIACFLMLLAVTGLRAQTTQSSIVGTWESDEKDVRMEYFQDGDHYGEQGVSKFAGGALAGSGEAAYLCEGESMAEVSRGEDRKKRVGWGRPSKR